MDIKLKVSFQYRPLVLRRNFKCKVNRSLFSTIRVTLHALRYAISQGEKDPSGQEMSAKALHMEIGYVFMIVHGRVETWRGSLLGYSMCHSLYSAMSMSHNTDCQTNRKFAARHQASMTTDDVGVNDTSIATDFRRI